MKLLYPKTGSRLKICYFCRPNGRSMTAATALMDFPFSLQQYTNFKTLMYLCLCRYLSVILYFFVTKLFAGNKRFLIPDSKWNLHTVCWDAVGCEWGTTSVYFWITYVCFIPSRLPVFAVEPQYRHQDFLFFEKYHLKGIYKIFKKVHVGLKFKWGL